MSRVIVCGNTCGHNHDSLNGPTGCCAKHGPYMYFCGTCQDNRATDPRRQQPAPSEATEKESGDE